MTNVEIVNSIIRIHEKESSNWVENAAKDIKALNCSEITLLFDWAIL